MSQHFSRFFATSIQIYLIKCRTFGRDFQNSCVLGCELDRYSITQPRTVYSTRVGCYSNSESRGETARDPGHYRTSFEGVSVSNTTKKNRQAKTVIAALVASKLASKTCKYHL